MARTGHTSASSGGGRERLQPPVGQRARDVSRRCGRVGPAHRNRAWLPAEHRSRRGMGAYDCRNAAGRCFVTMILLGVAVAFAVVAALTPILARGAHARGLLDIPNDRSLHAVSTPRIGGIAMIAAINSGFLISWAAGANPGFQVTALMGLATLVGILGFIDDVWQLSALLRLSCQTVIAAVTV